MPAALTRELTRFVEVKPAKHTGRKAVHAAIVATVTLTVVAVTMGIPNALIAMSGVFIAISAFDRSFRSRARVLSRLAVAYLIVVTIGALSSTLPLWLQMIVLAALATGVSFVYHALLSDPPGPMLLIMGAAIATYIPSLGVPIPHFLLVTTLAIVISCSTSLLLQSRNRRASVQRQLDDLQQAVDSLDEATAQAHEAKDAPSTPGGLPGKAATTALDRAELRDQAFAALFAAQAALVSSSARGRRLGAHHLQMEDEIHALHRRLVQHMISEDLPWAHLSPDAFEDHYVGSPREPYLLRWAFSSASPAWLAARRTGVAVLLAGSFSAALHLAHPYWAVMTAAIVLSTASDRITTGQRAGQRVVGTAIGVFLFLGLHSLHPPPVLTLVTVIACFALTQILAPRQYLLASIVLTPIPLLMASMHLSGQVEELIGSRVLETFIGAAAAMLVLWLPGRSTAIVLVRRQFRRALNAADAVLRQMAIDPSPSASMRVRRNLHFEQLAAARALAMVLPDQPEALAGWRDVEAALGELTYTILAAARTTDPTTVLDWKAMAVCLEAYIASLPPVSGRGIDPLGTVAALHHVLTVGRPSSSSAASEAAEERDGQP